MHSIDDVRSVCRRLADQGWGRLLAAHGLDISAKDLAAELARPLPGMRRGLQGFEDFSREGTRGVEPGRPQESLLYHALASPSVVSDDQGNALRAFPTLREIEIVEDYVFAAAKRSLDDVRQLVGGLPLEVVVFAVEYRPASETCSRVQADLVFARTGIARVGTAAARYDERHRGFLPEAEDDAFAIRALPARYAAYLAVQMRGNEHEFRPMRFQAGDSSLMFWTPVHKLFPGKDCLVGLDLSMEYSSSHVNEKIRRIHVALGEQKTPTTPPYRFTEGIAELSGDADHGRGLLVPVPHERLVVEAKAKNGTWVGYRVPKANGSNFAAFEVPTDGEYRSAPEYVHARTEIRKGTLVDLNQDDKHPDVLARVAAGGYEALHYVDFTGDGSIQVRVGGLPKATVPHNARAAYSLVTAPDFFPTCDQRELTEWTSSNAVPADMRNSIWPVPPMTLCDQRLAANLQLPKSPFDIEEVTVTALVPLFGPAPQLRTEPLPSESLRHAHLPDDAAGVFAPGWDVTQDRLNEKGRPRAVHLAAYGLGSPFPEDSKLCAALSTFWPAVAPDSTRTMDPPPNPRLRSTTSPLTDEEIGRSGHLPWDGISGPVEMTIDGKQVADFPSFMHSDYVRSALDGKFSMRLIARIGAGEYELRVLAMALVYRAIGDSRNEWMVLSFKSVSTGAPEVQEAEDQAKATLQAPVFFFELFRYAEPTVSPDDFRRRRIPITRRHQFYCDPVHRRVLMRRPGKGGFELAE